ncbi:AzlC family ABC transporter permease [Vibrio sp.]|nr:AzlC family ABC transporter permease [Vibrio sp.]
MESALVQQSKLDLFLKGTLAILPLSIAVIPWGLLAGSYAVDSGLSPFDSQALSTVLYAGAAQLAATGMLKAGASTLTMIITTFFITSRHLLYSISMRQNISQLPLKWRLTLGFLLTDELFAVIGNKKSQCFERWYALGAGLSFYLIWNIASFVGIFLGSSIPDLSSIGLDFAIVGTFIAIIIPTIKNIPILVTVLVAILSSVFFTVMNVESGLIITSVLAMVSGYVTEITVDRRK